MTKPKPCPPGIHTHLMKELIELIKEGGSTECGLLLGPTLGERELMKDIDKMFEAKLKETPPDDNNQA